MVHEILPVGLLQCNCSIFGDTATGEALVIDPGDNIDEILRIVTNHRLRVTAIFVTHAHIDHIGGAHKIKSLTKAPVYMNGNDHILYQHLDTQAAWLGMRPPERTEIDVDAKDGDSLSLGSVRFTVMHTPGHTQGSLCLWIPEEKKLVAGDTLFRDSIGRTDLPGGDGRQILKSIHDKLMRLPEDAIVVPGHGESTTIGREKEFNPFLQGF